MWVIELGVMIAMIGVNCVFAGYEIALASVSQTRLQRLAKDGKRGAQVALYMKQNMEASLAVVQLGITLVGTIAGAVGGAGAEERVAPLLTAHLGVSTSVAEFLAITTVVIPLTLVTILFGELIPKVFALRNSEWVCLTFSPLMRWFSFAAWPVVWLLETIVLLVMSWSERFLRSPSQTRPERIELQELRASAALARASRLIGARAENIILSASTMGMRPVREIILPAEFICTLDINASLEENLIAAHLDMHTRFPVVERAGDPQSIMGYVNVKDIVASLRVGSGETSLRAIVRPVLHLKDQLPLAECLEQMMRDRIHMAVVSNEQGQILGLVCLEDIVEELIGEIEDEYDRLPAYVIGLGRSWIVGGGITLDQLRESTGLDLASLAPAAEAKTLTEWLRGHLGRNVRGGDVVVREGIRAVVRKIRRKQALEVQLIRQPVIDELQATSQL